MRVLVLMLCLVLPSSAEVRSWRSKDGNRSFRGEFVSRNGEEVTFKREDGGMVKVGIGNLHADDLAWLKAWEAAAKEKEERRPFAGKGSAFADINFGESRAVVQAKLEKNEWITSTLNERLVGRTGLNGLYRVRFAGIPFLLFFHWTGENELREVTLRSEASPAEAYGKALKERWKSLAGALDKEHGKVVQTSPYPVRDELAEGRLLGSHLWYTPDKHSVLLCTGLERGGYVVAIRFAVEQIPPNELSTADREEPAAKP